MKTTCRNIQTYLFTGLLLSLGTGLSSAREELDDSEITNAVDDQLVEDAATPAWSIDVSTSEGIVTLSGTVSSALAKSRADKVASTVKGVRGIDDDIENAYEGGAIVVDNDLAVRYGPEYYQP